MPPSGLDQIVICHPGPMMVQTSSDHAVTRLQPPRLMLMLDSLSNQAVLQYAEAMLMLECHRPVVQQPQY